MAKNKTSWKPGKSGNPAGRPRLENSATAALREALTEQTTRDRTNARAIADKVVGMAKKGNTAAARLVFDALQRDIDSEARREIIERLELLEAKLNDREKAVLR
jgi:ribosomal protein L17